MNSRLIMQLNKLLIFLLVILALSACGQKGDLYLPDDKQALLNTSNLHA